MQNSRSQYTLYSIF